MSRGIVCFVFVVAGLVAQCTADEPTCNGDPNTYIGCKPNYCGQECNADQMLSPRVRCPHACIPGGCRCNDGYSYDTDAKICVLTDQCPPPSS